MLAVPLRDVAFVTEEQLLCELEGVFDKDVPFSGRSEVVEEVFVEDNVLDSVCAVDKLLVNFPADWTHVPELADRLLQVHSIVVQVLHDARTAAVEEIA